MIAAVDWMAAGTPLWAMVSGLSSQSRSRRALAMLQCFADETKDEHKFIMLGLISDARSWALFSDEWQECLGMRPPIEALHMSEFMQSTGDGSKLRLARFRKIIETHVKLSIAVIVSVKWFDHYFGPANGYRIYRLAFDEFINGYKAYCEDHGLEKEVQFVFDEQQGEAARIDAVWESVKRDASEELRKMIGPRPRFEDDKKVLPLQAADYCAWWVRRNMNHEEGKAPVLLSSWADDSGKITPIKVPGFALLYGKKQIKRILKDLDQNLIDPEWSYSVSF